MSEEEVTPSEAEAEEEEFVGFGKSFEDLEKELGGEEETSPLDEILEPKSKLFYLGKEEIAELAFNASIEFRNLVELHEQAGETIKMFDELSVEEQNEWTEVAGLALQMQGDPDDNNFARLVHAKTSMGLLKAGVKFDEKFLGDIEPNGVHSPLVAPWECLPHDRRMPLKIFKAMCRNLHAVWDRDNELLKR